MAVLFVFLPFAGVSGPISVLVDSFAMKLVVTPLALVDVAVGEDSPPFSVDLVVPPVTLIKGSVSCNQFSIAVACSLLGIPLAFVNGLVLELAERSGFNLDGNLWSLATIISGLSGKDLSDLVAHVFQHIVTLDVFDFLRELPELFTLKTT